MLTLILFTSTSCLRLVAERLQIGTIHFHCLSFTVIQILSDLEQKGGKGEINFSPITKCRCKTPSYSLLLYIAVRINDNSVISSPSDDVAYEMKWFLGRLRGSSSQTLLASMDRWGVVRKTPRNDSSDCSLERLGHRRFAMYVHSTQDSDVGDYHCTVTPWIRSPATGIWSKAPDVSSQRVFLNVKFACK